MEDGGQRSAVAPPDATAPSLDETGGLGAFRSSRARLVVMALQVASVVVVLALWFGVDSVRESRSLWVLFLYCLPSEFLVATVPHEPVMLYFARFYEPWVVALVSAAGTVATEALNYSVIRFFAERPSGRRFAEKTMVARTLRWFAKAPFSALLVAALTPIPFYPFRFLVVLGNYPVSLYLLAVLVGRTPRFYLLALVGSTLIIPNALLLGLFVLLIAVAYLPLAVRRYRSSVSARAAGRDPGSRS